MSGVLFSRRPLLVGAAGLGGLSVSGCDKLSENQRLQGVLQSADTLSLASQRFLQAGHAMATEFTTADLSPVFKANGSMTGAGPEYQRHVQTGFADWRLRIDGLVHRPLAFTLAQIRRMPSRTQITRHDCVEGWSAIGQWTGAPLGMILKAAGLMPQARYVVFHCADNLDANLAASGQYYESIDLVDAFHPQTILAHTLNGEPLSVGHGAPLRLRVEKQLGYKSLKFLHRIVVSDRFEDPGKIGPLQEGWAWYVGI